LRNQIRRDEISNATATAQAGRYSYEEYYPYGDTSYQSGRNQAEVQRKRYRYTGKEKDEETGLYYHGARYYAPWLGRWTAADPAGMVDGVCLYAYVRNHPTGLVDPDGMQSAVITPNIGENFDTYSHRAMSKGQSRSENNKAWRDVKSLSPTELNHFGSADQATIKSMDKWIEKQIQNYEQKLTNEAKAIATKKGIRHTLRQVQQWEGRINELQDQQASISGELKAGISHGSKLLFLANIVLNEAGTSNQSAKKGIAYAYLNMTGGTIREPRRGEISEYKKLGARWNATNASSRVTFLPNFIASIKAARSRLDDANPAFNDPTKGATHWISPIGLPDWSNQHGRYQRSEGSAADKAFPIWARDPKDPNVSKLQTGKNAILSPNYDEFSIPGVSREQFLFYIGVK